MGFVVRDMLRQIEPHILEKLSHCETVTTGHVKQIGFVDGQVRALTPGKRVVRTAVTAALPVQNETMPSGALSSVRPK